MLSLGVLLVLGVLLLLGVTELLTVILGVQGIQYSHPSLGLTLGIWLVLGVGAKAVKLSLTNCIFENMSGITIGMMQHQ